MEIRRIRHPDGLEFRISGRFDAFRSDRFEADLDEAVRSGEYHIRVDLSGVDFISSAGIGLLVRFCNRLKGSGGSFGIRAASEPVVHLLQISGLWEMLARDFPGGEAVPGAAEAAAPRRRTLGALSCELHAPETAGRLTCRCVGDPERLVRGDLGAADAVRLALPEGSLAVGLGAFGPGFSECRPRFGEFLAAGGAAVSRPTDESGTPDYLLARERLVPEVVALYALLLEGELDHFVRFQAVGPAGTAGLGEILGAVLELLAAPAAGLVMLAETAGLVGTALRRSPVAGPGIGQIFDFPAIRDWLAFTPEREQAGDLALVAGAAAAGSGRRLAGWLRPAAAAPVSAHCHAAVFSFRSLPRGRLALGATVRGLFEEERLQDMLHLLRDDREISGAGDSLFTRGVIWAGVLDIETEGGGS